MKLDLLPYGTRVMIKNTASDLDGKRGHIDGIASIHPGIVFYIVSLPEMLTAPAWEEVHDGFGYSSFTMIGSCLEKV